MVSTGATRPPAAAMKLVTFSPPSPVRMLVKMVHRRKRECQRATDDHMLGASFRGDGMDGMKEERGQSLYERDFYSWTQEQSGLLRSGQTNKIDLANLTEEIETLGRAERSALVSSYRSICLHQLKRLFQPEKSENRSWTRTIVRERNNVEANLEDNPGLKPQRTELFKRAYKHARREAAAETGLAPNVFPLIPPFTLEQIEDEGYWAEPAETGGKPEDSEPER